MTATANKTESRVTKLCRKAFSAFGQDISAMFEVEMQCKHQQTTTETIESIEESFEKLTGVISVKAQGVLEGTLQLVFDQGGLFILSGVTLMLPKNVVLAEIKGGKISDVEGMNDAIGEMGNLLVGCWDRIFREGLKGHGHFAQSGTFVGSPWDDPETTIDLADDDEFLFALYETTVAPYPPFKCGAIFPKTMLAGASDAQGEEDAEPEPQEQETAAEQGESEQTEPEQAEAKEAEPEQSASEGAEPEQSEPEEAEPEAAEPEETESEPAEPEPAESEQAKPEAAEPEQSEAEQAEAEEAEAEETEPEQAVSEAAEPVEPEASEPEQTEPEETEPEPAEPEAAEPEQTEPEAAEPEKAEPEPAEPEPAAVVEEDVPEDEPQEQAVAQDDTDRQASDEGASQAVRTFALGEGDLANIVGFRAEEIMDTNVVWSSPDDSVKQALAKMQEHNVGYIMVGDNGVLDGILSNSSVAGAVSPYLRPAFAKWRRPLDDATLNIRVKWIMSRPVRTVRPGASLAAIVDDMRHLGGRCLPVVDERSRVLGIVTVFDIFRLFSAGADMQTAGKPAQAPPMLV